MASVLSLLKGNWIEQMPLGYRAEIKLKELMPFIGQKYQGKGEERSFCLMKRTKKIHITTDWEITPLSLLQFAIGDHRAWDGNCMSEGGVLCCVWLQMSIMSLWQHWYLT